MRFSGPNLQLVPYSKEHWKTLAAWFYSEKYSELFRQHLTPLTEEQFKNFPDYLGGQVFMVFTKKANEPVGITYIVPHSKPNRSFYTALLVDEKFQGRRYPSEILTILYNHAFNNLGYRKGIVEVLEANESLVRTLKEAKFLLQGKLIGDCFMDGEFRNELSFCMLDSFYNKHYRDLAVSWEKLA